MIDYERSITYHTVTLGALTLAGHACAEIMTPDAEGNLHARTVHVPAGLPDEHVSIAVEAPPQPRPGRHRRHWKPHPPRVWITEILRPSPMRIQAPCPVFGTCGGCQLQHMQYAAQLTWKHDMVAQLLRTVGAFENPPLLVTVPCDIPWHYRNHMRFSVNRNGQPGLTARGSHHVLPLTACPIAAAPINRALAVLSQVPNERPQVVLRCGTATGQLLMQPAPQPAVQERLAAVGLHIHTETMEEQLAGETYRIRPSSFFQTNTAQAEKMARMVLHGLLDTDTTTHDMDAPISESGQRPLTVVDAYCGVGTFSLLLSRHVAKVIAIEESPSAIKDAQWNLREVPNVEILKGKVEDLLPALAPQLDGLVIDPPRAGCQQAVLDALIQHPVPRVVYVSCDPATLARDLDILCHRHPSYRLHSVQPLDMFPQTAHIECVAVLEQNTQ